MAEQITVETEVVVQERTDLAEGVVGLTLRAADGGVLPSWRPGAHVDLLLPGGLERQYSLCGDPADERAWRLGVLKEGPGSTFVHERLGIGDCLVARGPRNHFALEDAPGYLFLAGGIGITPILPMVAAAHAAGADWRLLYGGRRRTAMAFLDELSCYGDRVDVRPQDEFGLPDLDAALSGLAPGTLVYCCGPEPMLAAVEERCMPGALRTERFAAKPVTGPDEPFEVELALSGRTLKIEAGRSILETVEEAGVTVLSSCREGTCGTCETAVLDGEPDHRDSVLTEAERADGGFMMICVSRARTPRLTLEL
ncbi:PDR/VanB family oxidoreductase [Actinomadura opuntiae]|uniref:PDR/VanB family oxidoreductase n=1 Tax=Actinomadura sp. OS1-43 TaxID=604315 RepID=UPI00255B16EE|nr:PDR/VanB family oxidoreductase [Actinomadura sp. OS1-43]MDL4821480.1 PDR/VanB family oxidoreductase [Actinomadura sp. OS1-43]